jgi:hypothetical protein
MRQSGTATSIWMFPGILAAVTATGLLIALFNDGVYDTAGWLLLSIPLLTTIYFAARARTAQDAERRSGR